MPALWDWLWEWWQVRRGPRTLGQRGELLAARFLRRLGYRIVECRSRTPLGELDLIAVDGRTVVFVEVKTRRSAGAALPEEAVDQAKQLQLTRLALAWLKRHHLLECSARFDVVAIIWPDDGSAPAIKHVVSAFPAVGRGQMFA